MNLEPTQEESPHSIRIVNLDIELTWKADNSNEYDVHFDISGSPS